jgi:hypothetical protein
VPLQGDRCWRLRGGTLSGLVWGSRGRSRDWSRRRRLSRPLSSVLAESDGEFSLTHLIHTTTDALHQPLSASEHLFQTRLFLAEVHEVFLEFSVRRDRRSGRGGSMMGRTVAVDPRVGVVQGWQDVSVARRMCTTWSSASATHIARAKVSGRSDIASGGGEERARSIENHMAHLGGSKSSVQRRQIETTHMRGGVEGW